MTVLRERFTHPGAPDIEARNPFTVDGDTARLELTGGHYTTIDLADLPLVAGYRWYRSSRGYVVATLRRNGDKKTIHFHRIITGCNEVNKSVDHINGDKFLNRKQNLRVCSNQENSWNQRRVLSNQSGYKGVSLRKDTGKYRAKIKATGRIMRLGNYDTPEAAARAYDAAALEHIGEFARLNFPPLAA